MKNILVINAGSSSLKYEVIDMESGKVLAKGLVERIGMDDARLVHQPVIKNSEKIVIEKPIADHAAAMQAALDALTDSENGVIDDLSNIAAVGHRVLHGGEEFTESVVVDDGVMDALRANIDLGPLHMPPNIKGIETTMELMPGVPNVAVFDTAFHQTMPDYAFLYALPYDAYEKHKIRKYGFHGTSHKYLARRTPEFLHKDPEDLKMITCHLGNGSSLAAIKGGKCLDTTMGLTPLEGVAMGTRSGDLDAAVVPYLMDKYGMTIEQTMDYLNKQSGMLGVSGVSSDFRDLWDAAGKGNERARLALDLFSYRVKKYIGAFAAVLDGLDVLVFAGGVGENDHGVREKICEHMGYLGLHLDREANMVRGEEKIISTPDSKVTVVVIPTNEELMIAADTAEVAGV